CKNISKENNMKKFILATTFAHIVTITAAQTLETAMSYQKNEQFTQAIVCYEEIISEEPYNISALFQLGHCYLAIGEKEKALDAFNSIVQIEPNAIAAQYNLGYTYKTFGDLDKAIEIYQKVLQTCPDYEPAHLALGFAYITQGDFENGWQQHSRYLRQSGKNGDILRSLLENEDIIYKKILLRHEGGLGDTLNFIRYAELFHQMGADVIVSCQKQLIPLLSRCSYVDQFIPAGVQMPAYDADATLMSLPAIFEDTQETVPQNIPYIFADPALVTYWHQQLAQDTNFKIGLCWQVDVHNDQSKLPIARRGYPLAEFAVLANIENVSFYSLQRYDGTEQLATLPEQFKLHVFENLDEKSGPFMDTAAIIKNLDLIITVDTAIAHLAGALGCDVWLLHPYATADWRWIHRRTDSYWYPTIRIFKQHEPFGYTNVLKEVKQELIRLLKKAS
ncbi:MAG TPA: tetratricopeptide repeat protein, partial [Nitrosopumilaceae archaeon]|nr:tetratricopeptide repeat protein [Nitrosopumilaceae archaeon]